MRVPQIVVLSLGQIDIDDVELNPRSRDDIPAILKGIQELHRDPEVRKQILDLLSSHLLQDRSSNGNGRGEQDDRKKINPDNGRPGMSLWEILVLAILKQGLNCDYDRLHELACKHLDVRRMMGFGDVFDKEEVSYRTVLRNVSRVTPELLADINAIVARAGHRLVGHEEGAPLHARCDSFVVETDVEYPTDVRLLWDALRVLIVIMGVFFDEFGTRGWRQHKHWLEKGRRLFGRVRTARQYRKNRRHVKRYVAYGAETAERAARTLEELREQGVDADKLLLAQQFVEFVRKLADQVERRILRGETIPTAEKIYSVFVPFTRWCAKGKAGVPVELGVPVCVVEDEHQLILNHRIMWSESDVDLIPDIVEETQARHPQLAGCSFDKGFWNPAGLAALKKLLKQPVLPKKGRLSKADAARESEAEFQEARRRHPAVESAINNLEQRGLDRVREKSEAGFARMVALSILAANVHRIGVIVRDRERAILKKERLKKAA